MIDAPVLEHAMLDVRPGTSAQFEAAMAQALPIIESVPGCRGARVSRCLERPDTYLLLVGWDSVEAHTVGFRGSPDYGRWRELLHHFYEPFPVVEHFVDLERTRE
ncbi:antibiotic biosynthesis monooxygenase family protein [Cellulomonas rhizosphaerae]|uniref:Antibiotic biosynthesis monooxygenase n=1 Tax=Cellulomonas rhizosphaerae TaxID=2293719 RepID=A0A413RL38_9CELL|nr:antibiotic biosynthesis monooxygenase [Cellulomonas rhizosphaerae]RHA40313.1 antibiotic biosynthesis monooxygenase [Cellulomonas rhizosphaerae]